MLGRRPGIINEQNKSITQLSNPPTTNYGFDVFFTTDEEHEEELSDVLCFYKRTAFPKMTARKYQNDPD